MAEVIHNILVPVDGSKGAEKSVEYAAWVASKTGAKVNLLHVVDADKLKLKYEAMDRFQPEWADKIKHTDDIRRYSPYFEEQLQCMLDDPLCKRGDNVLDAMKTLAETYGGKPETMLKLGKVVDTILQVAEDERCDHIILGRTGLTGIQRMLIGHVAEKVARFAPCRVTLIPHDMEMKYD